MPFSSEGVKQKKKLSDMIKYLLSNLVHFDFNY